MSAKYNEGLFVEHRKICAKAIREEIIEFIGEGFQEETELKLGFEI